MIVKNFGDHSYGKSDFVGLQNDKKYWFPHAFKYVAWSIVIGSVIVSSLILILYGMSFGMIKTYLWATAFATSFLIGILITAPIRIMVLSCFRSIFLRKTPIIIRKKIPLPLLSNPTNAPKKNAVLQYRKYHTALYTPTPLYKLQSRFEDIKYNIELRNLTADTIAYLVFMLSLCYFVLINKTQMGFYSNEMVTELILSGKYTDSISFKEVNTYNKFITYLNETLLPALVLESPKNHNGQKPSGINKSLVQRSVSSKRKRQSPYESNNTDSKKRVFEKGWTMNHYMKLMGKPRLRQVRVKSSCKYLGELKARNYECAPELNFLNVEWGNFGLRWSRPTPEGLTPSQALPWIYQSAWESGSLPFYGKFSYYPGGGYILDLARHIDDARLILGFMNEFDWVDMKTRAIFIEFTLYNVNINMFNIVTLALEKSATGYMIPSYQVDTCKFIFVAHELESISFVMAGIFALLLFFFTLRESVRMHRTSFKTYIGWTYAVLDFTIIVFGAITFLFIILRSHYVSVLLQKLEKADNNEFVSFMFAGYWHSWSLYIEAVLILLAAFKFLRLLTFRVIFFQLQATLNHCYKHFIQLSLLQLIFLIAFANFFFLTLVNYSAKFSNVFDSLSTLFGRGVAYDDTFDLNLLSEGFWYLTPFFFWLFIVFIALLFVNVFIAIICFYFHIVRQTPLANKYNILNFLKFSLTKRNRKDILRLTYEKEEDTNDDFNSDLMRLKGGGSNLSRKKMFKKHNNEENDEIEVRKLLLKDFITESPYDTVQYMDLKENRTYAMRNLVASFLTLDIKKWLAYRENTMKILFCKLVLQEEGIERGDLNEIKGPYFSVVKASDTKILDKRIFYNMRKVVENFGKEKGWLIDEDKEIIHVEEKLTFLVEKLFHLHRKLSEK